MGVRFEVGPVDAAVARVWLTNSLGIVAAIRRRPELVPFLVEDALLDLVDVYLTVWTDVAEAADTFHWASVVDVEAIEQIAGQWQQIAALTDEQMAALGCWWAPEDAAPFYEALLRGVVEALRQDPATSPLGDELAVRPPGATAGP